MEPEITAQRAGVYVRQPTGYRAFMPAPLPPNPPILLEGALAALLSDANLAIGRLDGSVLTLPNPELFIFMYVRKEAVLSSQIEGTQSSLQDLLAAEAALYDDSRPRDVDEVINYVSALKLGLASLAELPVSVRLIRNIHAELMKGVRGSIPPALYPHLRMRLRLRWGRWRSFCTSTTACRPWSKSLWLMCSLKQSTHFWMATAAWGAC
jgi:hypothetical protein